MSSPRQVFYISDRTGLTAENIGEALLNQFGNLSFKRHTHPFVDTPEKARAVVEKVNRSRQENGQRPIAFVSVVDDEIRRIIKGADAFQINFFETFLDCWRRNSIPKQRYPGRGITVSAIRSVTMRVWRRSIFL